MVFLPAQSWAQESQAPQRVALPSAVPGDSKRDDTIWFDFFPAHVSDGEHAPAIILLHSLGDEMHDFVLLRRYAANFAGRGISAAVMMLPYHMYRLPAGDTPAQHYLSADSRLVQQAFAQARSDVSTVVTWLSAQPVVDNARIGVVGTSLGAIVAHLAMGSDSRITAGVAALGGGDMPFLARSSILFRLDHPGRAERLTAADLTRLDTIDPLTTAAANQPRHVLMIEAARDIIVPPRSATELWEALGKPRISWVDTGHIITEMDSGELMRAAYDYLAITWELPGAPKQLVVSLHPPTVTFGFAFGPATGVTPTVNWLAIPMGREPNHTTLLHLDLGLGFSGPFADAAFTLTPMVDVGYGYRFFGGNDGLYVSLHIAL